MRRLKRFLGWVDRLVHSIRFRLVLWYAVILVGILAALTVFVTVVETRDVHNDVLTRLENRASLLVGRRSFGALLIPDNFVDSNEVLVVTGVDGSVLATQGTAVPQDFVLQALHVWQVQSQQSNLPLSVVALTGNLPSTHTGYYFLVAPVGDRDNIQGFAILGSPLDPGGQLRRLLLTMLAGSLLTLAIALGGGLWLADRAMRPVRTITQAAREISDTDLSRRLNMKGRDELGQLADTFDGMLARLQAAFERQRQFVADASHELRTPLTIVNLETTRALAGKRPAGEYQRALTVIRSENDFMSALVNDLLVLARMDAGQTNVELKPVDLADVAIEAVERLEGLAARNGVRVEIGDLPEAPMRGDRQYLLQMISNLVDNAIKYTTGPERRVCVETGTRERLAWVRVSDSGPGIPPEHLAHIFDRFYRADQARTRGDPENTAAPSGSGLGLSIVQWIAQAHAGQVHVTSQVGEGTTFEVTFPSAEGRAAGVETKEQGT